MFIIGQKSVQNQRLCLPNTVVSPENILTNLTFWSEIEAILTVFSNCLNERHKRQRIKLKTLPEQY